jgi:hypothetical protein
LNQNATFSARVQLYASTGRWVREIGAVEAARLLHAGAKVRSKRKGEIREIEMACAPGAPIGPPSPPRLTAFMGQKYTRIEVNEQSHCIAFRPIHPDDQPLFLLSITDCGGALRRVCTPRYEP